LTKAVTAGEPTETELLIVTASEVNATSSERKKGKEKLQNKTCPHLRRITKIVKSKP
jgi:hypothetical protein